MVFTTALGIITAGLVIVQAIILGELLASVFMDGKQLSSVRGQIVGLALIVIVRTALSWLNDVVATRSSALAKNQLRTAVMDKVADLGPVWVSSQRSAELATVATRGLDALDVYFARYLPQLILAAVIPLSVGVVILTQDVLSAVIVALTVPLIPFFMALIGKFTQDKVDSQWNTLATLSGHFLDLIAGLPTLKAFNRSKNQARAIREVGDDYRSATMGVLRISFLSAFVLELIATLSVALVAVSIGLRLVNGSFHLREGLIILILVPEAYIPLRQLGTHFHAVQEGMGAAVRLFEVLDTESPQEVSLGQQAPTEPQTVNFQGVHFTYPGYDVEALSDFTATFTSGTFTAVTGPSGAGKSTALNVLLKFVDPTKGTVTVDGHPLTELDTASWREKISLVSQHPWIPNGTIREAIAMAKPWATDSHIAQACAQAGLNVTDTHEFAAGLDTHISPSSGVSVGQRRRIALARAFLRDAPIVVLDEPTASLDGATEDLITQSIADLKARGKIVISVTHRESLIAIADQVVAL